MEKISTKAAPKFQENEDKYPCIEHKAAKQKTEEKAPFLPSYKMSLSHLLVLSLAVCYVLCRQFALPSEETVCYAEDFTPFLFFGTKTSYEVARGHDDTPRRDASSCHPAQFWFLSRHGTRYPEEEDIPVFNEILPPLRDSILTNHNEHHGQLCEADLLNLKAWKLNIDDGVNADITPSGQEELFHLATRYKGRFPSLLGREYDESLYTFVVTKKKRTKQSAEAFSSGLFGDSIKPAITENNTFLKYYKECDSYVRQDEDPNSKIEYTLFLEGVLMQSVLHNISIRLGFQEDLSYDTVKVIYDMCRYNKAWDMNLVSPWCGAFVEEEFLILEYAEDLKNYYESGYGHDLNVQLGCPLVKDMVEHFRGIDGSSPLGIIYFTHSTIVQFFASRLGIGKDNETLRHDNYDAMKDRQWRTSLICPFSANMAAIFYECEDEPKVEFYFQEKPFLLEGCEDTLCSWITVQKQLADIVNTCDLTELCT